MKKVLRWSRLEFRKEYFLFLLPLFFVFHGFNEYYGKIPLQDALWLLVQYELVLCLMALAFFLFFRSFRKAAVFSFLLGCGLFFFGAVQDWFKGILSGSVLTHYTFVLPAIFLVFAGIFLYFRNTKRTFTRTVPYLNLLFGFLMLVEVVTVAARKLPHQEIVEAATVNNKAAPLLKPCDTCQKEDVHLIILDEYAGERQLKEELHFDNSAFLAALASRGFHVVEGARSNYNYTELSMASLLSLDYLNNLKGKNDNELYYIGSSVIKQNIFTRYLINNGYRVHNLSIFDIGASPALNKHFQPGINLVASNTLWGRIKKDLGFHIYTMPVSYVFGNPEQIIRREAGQNRSTMDALLHAMSVEPGGQPQFYYTHLMLPHVPYYFDKDGQFTGLQRYLYPGDSALWNSAYLEYLQYTNKVVLGFVDSILKRSSRPPVILLMGDHGNRHHSLKKESHFSALNAIYFPDRYYEGFYDGLSHVNQLRLLLNHRFGQSLPLLKDTSFYLGK